MNEAKTSTDMSMGLLKVMERARKEPQGKMRSLAHHIDEEALKKAFGRIRRNTAAGVDGVTKDEYGENLEQNVLDLHGRLKTMKYRHQPIRRVRIPKGNVRDRPIGISSIEDRRPPKSQKKGKGPGTFDFLGFTHYWRRSREGKWSPAWKTRPKSLQKAVRSIQSWCKTNLHLSIPEQQIALTRRLRGHFNYFGVNGNQRCLSMLLEKVKRSWFRWLKRRSQRSPMTWERFNGILKDFPLPKVKVYKNLWATS